MPRRLWSRREVLIGGAAVAVAGVPVPDARADDESDEALLRLGASAELVATAFYTRALGSRRFDRRERELLLRARFADQRHYSRLVAALGPGAPTAEDLDVRLPAAAFRSRAAAVALGLRIERAIAGIYVEAAATRRGTRTAGARRKPRRERGDTCRRSRVARGGSPARSAAAGLHRRRARDRAARAFLGVTMAKETYTASEAARALGISLDTLRRWDRDGPDRASSATRRTGASSRPPRSTGCAARERDELSARNRFRGVVRAVEVEGLLAQVEIDVTEPTRVVAIDHPRRRRGARPAARDAGDGVVKSTSVMVER